MNKFKSVKNWNIKLMFIIVIFSLIMLSSLITQKPNSVNQTMVNTINRDSYLRTSGADTVVSEWLTNREFTLPLDPWTNISAGDVSDINATADGVTANYEILGDSGSFSSLEAYPNASGEWYTFLNPEYPSFPIDASYNERHGIDSEGWWADHHWEENFDAEYARPSVLWKRNFTLSVNMADYAITSIDLGALVNGSCEKAGAQGGIDIKTDPGLKSVLTGDFARFYVIVSDFNNIEHYEVAYNQTSTLGDDNHPGVIDYMYDSSMTIYTEEILIAFLTSIFERSGNSFTITLGININCEDNQATDRDFWYGLRIKDFYLNFTYEKKIDRYSSLTFQQIGNAIPSEVNSTPIEVDSAILKFKYSIDKNWPTLLSPNSEIRVLINGTASPLSVKLSSATSSFQWATFDLTALMVSYDTNVTTMIQVIMLDNFVLNDTYIISIDNASLVISYSKVGTVQPTMYNLFLNGQNKTLSGLIEVAFGETVNITLKYMKESDGKFLNSSDVTISGPSIGTQNLTENLALEFYNITIDTTYLSIGENPLTLLADRLWWETQEIIVNIKVLARTADLNIFLNGANRTTQKSIFLTAGNPLNITVILKDSITKNFVNNASVKIYKGEEWNKTLIENSTFKLYTVNVSTITELDPGITFLSLLIERENYTSIGVSLTISISVRSSNYSLELDGVDKTAYPTISKNVNETIDIKFYYRDELDMTPIAGANVSLIIVSTEYDLEENAGYYNISINTLDLNQGINFATVFAQHPQYSPQALLITIEIVQKETDLQLFINGTTKTSDPTYTVIVGDDINITIKYLDNQTKAHILNASIELFGGSVDNNLTEYQSLSQYTIIIDSANLDSVINFLSIYAFKANYEAQSITVKVEVVDKDSSAQLFLDTLNKTTERYIQLNWNEILNITVTYKDVDGIHIGGANVSIEGSGILKQFNPGLSQYELYLNTTELGVGVHFLVILATKANYDTKTISIQIDITRRVAIIDKVFINEIEEKAYEILWNEDINVTIVYLDNATNITIFGALLQLKKGSTLLGNFGYDGTYDQFSITINSAILKIGLHYLTISAVLENYTSVSEVLTINVKQRETELTLWLNNTLTSSIDIDWNENLDILCIYNDSDTGALVTTATIQIKRGTTLLSNFNESAFNYYHTINTTVLGVGAFYLTITATRANYSSITQFIFVTVNNRETTLEIILNNLTITEDKFAEVPLGRGLNISLIYKDAKTNASILGANIELFLKTLSLGNFIYNPINDTYNITADTGVNFVVGLNILTIEAELQNYTLDNPTLRITVRRINVEIYPENGTSLIKIEPGQDILIRVQLVDHDFGEILDTATIRYTSNIPMAQYHQGTLEHIGGGVYEAILNDVDVPSGTYIITISVEGGTDETGKDWDNYEIDRLEITIDVKAPENPLFQILMYIAIGAVIAIGAYVVYYQRVGKYPVPVRKVRKTKKMFKKNKFTDLGVSDRKSLFSDLYEEEFQTRSKALRPKTKKAAAVVPTGPITKSKLTTKEKTIKEPKKPKPVKEPEKPAPTKEPEKSVPTKEPDKPSNT